MMVVVGLAVAVLAPSARADEAARARAWFEGWLAEASEPLNVENVLIRWRATVTTETTRSIEEIRAVVRGKPDHPDRQLLQDLERGPSHFSYSAWVAETGLWRVSRDGGKDRSPFLDYGVNADAGWRLHDNHLARETLDAPNRFAVLAAQQWQFLLSHSFHAFADVYFKERGVIDAFSLNGADWSARVVRESDGVAMTLVGKWDPGKGEGQLVRTEVRASDGQISERAEYSNWTRENPWGKPMARGIDVREYSRQRHEQLTIESIAPVERAKVAELAATPEVGQPDPVRGLVKIRTVADNRSDGATYSDAAADGTLTTKFEVPHPEARGSTERPIVKDSTLKVVGWSVLGLAAAVLIIVKVRGRLW